MTKEQLKYLSSKINSATNAAIQKYTKEHMPVEHDRKTVAEALKEAGFLSHKSNYFDPFTMDKEDNNLLFAAGYVTLPPTREMQANREAVKAFTDAARTAEREAIDAANLGDSADALALLAQFTEALKAIK